MSAQLKLCVLSECVSSSVSACVNKCVRGARPDLAHQRTHFSFFFNELILIFLFGSVFSNRKGADSAKFRGDSPNCRVNDTVNHATFCRVCDAIISLFVA